MLKETELGHRIDKETYEAEVPRLRFDLLKLQYDLRDADFSVIVLLSGDDRIGVAETIHVLNEWMDPRSLEVHALVEVTEEERLHPEYWRYWRLLPAAGRIGLFFRDWTTLAIADRVAKRKNEAGFLRSLDHIRRLERMLVDDGARVVKFWLHLGKSEHAKRLKRSKKNPEKEWRVHERDRLIFENYDRAIKVVEAALRETSSLGALWQVVESTDSRHRNLTVARILHDAVRERLDRAPEPSAGASSPPAGTGAGPMPLRSVDLSHALPREDYSKQLDQYQRKLHSLSHQALDRGISSVLVFEGWDAAGKGGVIRRLTSALDPSYYRVSPIAAPTDEEKGHHYLWRFWRRLPRAGHIAIFDRSWYGRVMVERVEGFATTGEWGRAYAEINEFESMLCEHGILVLKFWLHIDKDEQLRRFEARKTTPFKKYKLTDEDFRNREKWEDYEVAVNEMISRTSTDLAPWEMIAANDKRWARVEVLRAVCRRLQRLLK
jgi:polyphosphate:AMP phosphotransferase